MKKEGKIIITDINADRNREENLIKYQKLLATAFCNYAVIKLSMNLFTMIEKSEEIDTSRVEEIEGYIDTINGALRETIVENNTDLDSILEEVNAARDAITSKMKILTYYTDALEIYEYILNRREADVKGITEENIDIDSLVNDMYSFVFSENDKMLINTRIQEFIAQLPVRITKQRFYDIISGALIIYRGGEQKSLDEFVETIMDASLVNKPEGYDTEYPLLIEALDILRSADYKNLSSSDYDKLDNIIGDATEVITDAVTDYMMLTEIINDVLIILYTYGFKDDSYLGKDYKIASDIIASILHADDIYQASEKFDELFCELEGSQESAYEELVSIESNLDDLYATYGDMYENEQIKDRFNLLSKADMLTSTSLFMDIDRDIVVVNEEADDIYINETKEEIAAALDARFSEVTKFEKRSIMAKVLSLMPVFFNSRDEITDYFRYALSSCTDNSELTACKNIIYDMISAN